MNNLRPSQTIQASEDSLKSYLKKLWYYRYMIWAFAKRDIKAKYAQTFIGISWSVIQPLIALTIFVFLFEKIIPISNKIAYPYSIFAFSGMVCWQYFTQQIVQAGTALHQEQSLIKKMYFPKLILPLSKSLSGLADYITSFFLLLLLMYWKGIPIHLQVLFLPIVLLLNIFVGLSLSIWLSILTIRYRDFHHIIPYIVNFGSWLTPVFYPATLVPNDYKLLLYLNPMAGTIELFRWTLVGESTFQVAYLLGYAIALLFFISGILFFVKMEDKIIDIV
jgi:lipopolysaccharide transport system permease protein